MQKRSFSRRKFLQLTGLSLGVGMTAGAATETAAAAARSDGSRSLPPRQRLINCGVFVPHAMPQAALTALFKGFQANTATAAWSSTFTTYAYADLETDAALKRLHDEQLNLALIIGGPLQLGSLNQAFKDAGIVAVGTGMGATIPRFDEATSHIVQAFWPHWQTEWALGMWAAQTVGRRAVIGTASYESGFDSAYAFWAGFEAAGGSVVEAVVTHNPGTNDGVTALAQAVKNHRPDIIYGAVSGLPANDVLGLWQNEWRAQGHQLLLNASFLGMGGVSASRAAGAIVAQPQFPQFVAQQPMRWGQLGAGLREIINASAQRLGGDFSNPDTFQNALTAAQPASGLSNSLAIPATTIATINTTSRAIRLSAIAKTQASTAPDALRDIANAIRSGWIEPYLA